MRSYLDVAAMGQSLRDLRELIFSFSLKSAFQWSSLDTEKGHHCELVQSILSILVIPAKSPEHAAVQLATNLHLDFDFFCWRRLRHPQASTPFSFTNSHSLSWVNTLTLMIFHDIYIEDIYRVLWIVSALNSPRSQCNWAALKICRPLLSQVAPQSTGPIGHVEAAPVLKMSEQVTNRPHECEEVEWHQVRPCCFAHCSNPHEGHLPDSFHQYQQLEDVKSRAASSTFPKQKNMRDTDSQLPSHPESLLYKLAEAAAAVYWSHQGSGSSLQLECKQRSSSPLASKAWHRWLTEPTMAKHRCLKCDSQMLLSTVMEGSWAGQLVYYRSFFGKLGPISSVLHRPSLGLLAHDSDHRQGEILGLNCRDWIMVYICIMDL